MLRELSLCIYCVALQEGPPSSYNSREALQSVGMNKRLICGSGGVRNVNRQRREFCKAFSSGSSSRMTFPHLSR